VPQCPSQGKTPVPQRRHLRQGSAGRPSIVSTLLCEWSVNGLAPSHDMGYAHLVKTCLQEVTSSKLGWKGTGSSCSSSLAVGIQKQSLPPSSSEATAKASRSSMIATSPYGFFGGL
jgi:hypothetical protein